MNQQRKFFVLLALCANFAAQLSAQKLLPVSVAVSTNYQLNGVAVSHDDRIFLALPRWVQSDSFSVGEVKDGKVVAYPGGDWNTWHQGLDEENRFTAVNAVWIEPGLPDALWVVDCGQGIAHGKKLVEIDLKSNTVSRVYHFSQKDAPLAACLNDVRIARGNAFLTESGLGATRPLDDEPRLTQMLRGADLIVTARLQTAGSPLVGAARGVTDFAVMTPPLGDTTAQL